MSGGIVVAARVDILLFLLLMTRLLPIFDSLWLPWKQLLPSQAILYVYNEVMNSRNKGRCLGKIFASLPSDDECVSKCFCIPSPLYSICWLNNMFAFFVHWLIARELEDDRVFYLLFYNRGLLFLLLLGLSCWRIRYCSSLKFAYGNIHVERHLTRNCRCHNEACACYSLVTEFQLFVHTTNGQKFSKFVSPPGDLVKQVETIH